MKPFLLDNSAFARLRTPEVREALEDPMRRGIVRISPVLILEGGYSARNGAEHEQWTRDAQAFTSVSITPDDWETAFETQHRLAVAGTHRGVGIPDLLQAAVAARLSMVVVHYDHDFDLIAAVTGQATQWVVPRGTVP